MILNYEGKTGVYMKETPVLTRKLKVSDMKFHKHGSSFFINTVFTKLKV